ncbi:aminotransferase class IV [Nitritalea halalkaliphila]|nr:aminotransferase class IV [Nitritalea halalkaliphila]
MNDKVYDFETIYLLRVEGSWQLAEALPPNRGFFFGENSFETMCWAEDRLLFQALHGERRKKACQIFDWPEKTLSSFSDMESCIRQYLPAHCKRARVRYDVCKSGQGLYLSTEAPLLEWISLNPWREAPTRKAKAAWSEELSVPLTPWSAVKTGSALVYVWAAREKKRRGLDELLLRNSRGEICECAASNVFWSDGEQIFTPALSSGCIAGIGRERIKQATQQAGLTFIEGLFLPEILERAPYVWTSNVTGISWVQQLEGRDLLNPLEKFPFLRTLTLPE